MIKLSRLIPQFTLLLWLSSLVAKSNASSFTAQVPPGAEECFTVRIPQGKTSIIAGSFEVENEKVNPADFTATITELPKGHIVYQAPKRTLEGSFKVESNPQASRYSICFHNNARDDDEDNDFEVGFSIRVSNPIRALDVGEIGPDTEKAFKLVKKAAEIHEDWAVMLDHLDFAHNREAVYEDLANSILYRLAKWTYIEAFLVIGMATGQVMYWKKFFETRRYL